MTALDLDAIRSRVANSAISPHLPLTRKYVLTHDVPALLEEVERLHGENEQLRQANHDLRGEAMRRSSESWLAGYEAAKQSRENERR